MIQSTGNNLLYEAYDFPVFQNRMYDTFEDAIACPKGDIKLVESLDTGLVYNATFDQSLMVYDKNYQNEQGVSGLFEQHLHDMSEIIQQTMGLSNIVEVGCGKGFFLEMLLQKGFDITGFDPTYEGSNPRVEKHYFNKDLGIRAKGLILRHVLEHIKDPVSFLHELKEANGGSGLIYIEVPCFDWICKKKAWFDIFYEHVNYFRLSDFYRIFGRIKDSGRVFGKQYMYVVADLSSLVIPVIDLNDRVNFPSNFLGKLKEKVISKEANLAIWGGASKGVIFSLLKAREGESVDIVIDINPSKQGKFLPATGLKVMSLTEGLSKLSINSVIYVMNSNYLVEIKEMSNNEYNYVSIDNE